MRDVTALDVAVGVGTIAWMASRPLRTYVEFPSIRRAHPVGNVQSYGSDEPLFDSTDGLDNSPSTSEVDVTTLPSRSYVLELTTGMESLYPVSDALRTRLPNAS